MDPRPEEAEPAREQPIGNGDTLPKLLAHAAAEWRATFDAIASPIIILDGEARVRRLNRAARDLTSLEYQEIIGRHVAEVGGGRLCDSAAELAGRAVNDRGMLSLEVVDAERRTIWDVAAHYSDGNPEAPSPQVIIVARDITRLAELQESLRRSETLAALGSLVAGVVHQVRNPLFGVSAAVDALESRFGDRPELVRYVEALRDPVRRLSRLLDGLLSYGRPASPERKRVDLSGTVAAACRSCEVLKGRHGVVLETALHEPAAVVLADRDRLLEALANVIENAIENSPRGGRVVVELATEVDGGRSWYVCRVRDEGPGFQDEDLPRLGEPFFVRRHGGTGLGLAVTRRIVDDAGGSLRFANTSGGGAEVTIRLPVSPGGALGS